jgi:hypothetical protein
MSYTSYKLDKNENALYPEKVNNYADTFKEEKDTASLSNVFHQNLGRSGLDYDLKSQLNLDREYNQFVDMDNSKNSDDLYNNEDKNRDSLEHENENQIKAADDLEIYEDKNNHIEEFNEEVNGELREENQKLIY